MFRDVSRRWRLAAWTVSLACAVSPAARRAVAGCPVCQQAQSTAADAAGRKARAASQSTPHHGQVTRVRDGAIEVVYLPTETRVYLYNPAGQPLSAAKVHGELNLQVLGAWEEVFPFRYPLTYTAAGTGTKESDYLAAAVSQRTVRDGYMTVDVKLTGLPFREHEAKFSQVFASSLPRTKVTVAALDESDKAVIARQKTCPVSGAALGSMGDPIKALVGDKGSLYLCCKHCLVKVEDDPENYLAKAVKLRAVK
jgi:hypothetical protein